MAQENECGSGLPDIVFFMTRRSVILSNEVLPYPHTSRKSRLKCLFQTPSSDNTVRNNPMKHISETKMVISLHPMRYLVPLRPVLGVGIHINPFNFTALEFIV